MADRPAGDARDSVARLRLTGARGLTVAQVQPVAGGVGEHLSSVDVLHDVAEEPYDRMPVAVRRLLVAARESDEADPQLVRDLFVVVGVTQPSARAALCGQDVQRSLSL